MHYDDSDGNALPEGSIRVKIIIPPTWCVGNLVSVKVPYFKRTYVARVPDGLSRGDQFFAILSDDDLLSKLEDRPVDHVANKKVAAILLRKLIGIEHTQKFGNREINWTVVNPEDVTEDLYADVVAEASPDAATSSHPAATMATPPRAGRAGAPATSTNAGSTSPDPAAIAGPAAAPAAVANNGAAATATAGATNDQPPDFVVKNGDWVRVGRQRTPGVVFGDKDSRGRWPVRLMGTTEDLLVPEADIFPFDPPKQPEPLNQTLPPLKKFWAKAAINADRSLPNDYTLRRLFNRLLPVDFEEQAKVVNERRAAEADNSTRLKAVTEQEIARFWGLIIAGALSNELGEQNWSAPRDEFSMSFRFVDVMPFRRFRMLKEYVPFAHYMKGYDATKHSKWDRVRRGLEGFMDKRNGFLNLSTIAVIDELMSAFKPRTTKDGTYFKKVHPAFFFFSFFFSSFLLCSI